MTDPRDDLDAWLEAQVQPLPPPPGTFELIRKRARRRKVTRAARSRARAWNRSALMVPSGRPSSVATSRTGKPA
jgi:hypothetical protein